MLSNLRPSVRVLSTARLSIRSSSTSTTTTESIEVSSSQQQQQQQQTQQDVDEAFSHTANDESASALSATREASVPLKSIPVFESLNFAAYKSSKKNYINSLPKVPSTDGIQRNELMLDALFNNFQPLLQPVKSNHTRSPLSLSMSLSPKKFKKLKLQNSSILKDLENYKKIKSESNVENYSPYFSKSKKFTPINSIFTNSALNTQQHNLELFNLPLSYVESLKPFQAPSLPGNELYRDDMIYTRKLEIEEKKLNQRKLNKLKSEADLELAKKGLKKLKIDNFEEFFGFK